ncbi:hypothetical protein DVA67_032035 [Solirubrobacter sp. CPCC 204708]|uniref:Dipeptidylpeptidase IV N-terminal domain-containing protein n=1 Tax=Solirubrobacter deserti TaxID=2282478 RepID=A0ABT4RQ38_9ACTN|nr:hypothetical protein [Solirubrobacter deserti]MBE2320634.1 hypothetical protein [Solirubrobacter deserti]MDA0140688.1 hypothetical protein [Solirubrobacter deserti]
MSDAAWAPDGTSLLFARFTITETKLSSEIVMRDAASGADGLLVTQDGGPRLASMTTPSY